MAERESGMPANGLPSASTDSGTKSGRGSEGGRGSRKK